MLQSDWTTNSPLPVGSRVVFYKPANQPTPKPQRFGFSEKKLNYFYHLLQLFALNGIASYYLNGEIIFGSRYYPTLPNLIFHCSPVENFLAGYTVIPEELI